MRNHSESSFCFRGDRTYIFGADIYNRLIEILRNDGIKNSAIDLSVHGISKTNLDIVGKEDVAGRSVKFVLTYTNSDNKRSQLFGIENGRKIDCRHPFPEEKIRDAADLISAEKAVELGVDTGFGFIDNVLIANKKLLTALFPDTGGKWYFTRLQLNKIVADDFCRIKLIHKSRFGFKLAKTEIHVGGDPVGFVYTSLVEE